MKDVSSQLPLWVIPEEDEILDLPHTKEQPSAMRKATTEVEEKPSLWLLVTLFALSLLLFYDQKPDHSRPALSEERGDSKTSLRFDTQEICPVYKVIRPKSYIQDPKPLLRILRDPLFRNASAEKLSGAVQIDTTVGDGWPDVRDDPKRWEFFSLFHVYLKLTFPLLHDTLSLEKVNTYGLLYTWHGSDSILKPVTFMAHQDVVPVQNFTISDWTYPPFSGKVVNNTAVWGRGSSDCKNLLVAVLEAVELLISQGFKPRRTVLLSFGFDEETTGANGAKQLAKVLTDRYNSLYAIIDEGAGLFPVPNPKDGTKKWFAIPGTSEKGSLDVAIDLTTEGGHSSVPPAHTSIGIMGELGYLLELHPYEASLSDPKNPMLLLMQCMGKYSPENSLPESLRRDMIHVGHSDTARQRVLKFLSSNPAYLSLVKTTQALVVINGGEKNNALPEHVRLVVNHRISTDETVGSTIEHLLEVVQSIADKYHYPVYYDNKTVSLQKFRIENADYKSLGSSWGEFNITILDSLEPAPISLTRDDVWKVLAGTTRHVFEDAVFNADTLFGCLMTTDSVIVSPALMPANTDTRYYWNLTPNIYRFTPGTSLFNEANIHSVDEHMDIDSHLQLLAWYYEYIQNVDEAA
ncbi:hypothetical protein BABINDRAFT_160894 [Babjeviella inositovora NRRL Y-12698]|uniref:Peptidase M20 dimerisation domain-containing protein n=1 Tax=Babjeviella inositovora NRRL Y-12698 TaxID=984486 RepID=A0A1E3QUN0_9ASCO|nr:uncharacterized protein BABINDRAFT_160894 [Babjeviella inositovora NRRL Y-12698]ODQ80647.1 hypothetical protein BABINDRAFT_160894 [Babjeviella inositovora NRRL Y-12698]